MTEKEYMDTANLARLRCAMVLLREFIFLEDYKSKISNHVTIAFRSLDKATEEVSKRIKVADD